MEARQLAVVVVVAAEVTAVEAAVVGYRWTFLKNASCHTGLETGFESGLTG